MAWYEDSSESFTINLLVDEGEGKGILAYMVLQNYTTGAISSWIPSIGWSGDPLEANEGDSILFHVEVENQSDTEDGDVIYCEVTSTPPGIFVPSIQYAFVLWDERLEVEWTFDMPSQNLDILINAGHEV